MQRESRSFLNDYRLSSEWSQIRSNLRVIADAYELSWADFDDGYHRRDNPYPRDRNGDYRRNDEAEPAAPGVKAPYTLNYRFVMEAGEAILPKPPIK